MKQLKSSVVRPSPFVVVVGAAKGYIQAVHEFKACAGGCKKPVVVIAAMKRETAEKFAKCEPCFKKAGLAKWRAQAQADLAKLPDAIQLAIEQANSAAEAIDGRKK